MNLKAWLFLVGKNRQTGYRPVVVPDILYAANVPGQLDRFRSNQVRDQPVCEVVDIKGIGPVTAIYRVTYMTNRSDDSVYTDLQNRPIIWSAGILIRGNYPGLQLPTDVFEFVRQQLESYAEKFYLDDHKATSFTSQAFEIELCGENAEETIKHLRETLVELRKQEEELVNYISSLDRKAQTGKTMAYVGIPLILVIVGFVVIPIGLYMSKSANDEKKDPEANLQMLREHIRQIEDAIRKLDGI